MATARQQLGAKGEKSIRDHVPCPRCNRPRHLTPLQRNFQCADLICKFCGYLAQVKAVTLRGDSHELPSRILGAAWGPQHEQIMAGIYHGLFIACFSEAGKLVRIDYIPAHILQTCPAIFEPRKPLSASARRAGWRGFIYNLDEVPAVGVKQLFPS
jgi:type II restriction enzyme